MAARRWPARSALFLIWSVRLVPAGNAGQCAALEQALELLWALGSIAGNRRVAGMMLRERHSSFAPDCWRVPVVRAVSGEA